MRKSSSVIVGFLVVVAMWSVHFASKHLRNSSAIAGHIASTTETPSAFVRSLRPSYPFSIIPGGAYSANELRFADSKDSVVRTHYASFNLKNAKVMRLVDDRYQYVSYRIKNQVYWTKRKLRIPSGELLLSDGTEYARARCGNRLSDRPHPEASSSQEPPASVLSLPPVNMDMLPQLALATPPEKTQIPNDPRTAAEIPQATSGVSSAPVVSGQPYIPLTATWGGQPVLGGFAPGSLASPLSGPPASPSSSSSVGTTSNPPAPPDDPTKPPETAAPVPEANTAYMVFVTMLFAAWAILRTRRKNKLQKGG